MSSSCSTFVMWSPRSCSRIHISIYLAHPLPGQGRTCWSWSQYEALFHPVPCSHISCVRTCSHHFVLKRWRCWGEIDWDWGFWCLTKHSNRRAMCSLGTMSLTYVNVTEYKLWLQGVNPELSLCFLASHGSSQLMLAPGTCVDGWTWLTSFNVCHWGSKIEYQSENVLMLGLALRPSCSPPGPVSDSDSPLSLTVKEQVGIKDVISA